MNNIKARVDQINDIILKLEAERDNIRNNICKHESTISAIWSDGPGNMYPAKVCSTCGHNLGALTPEPEK